MKIFSSLVIAYLLGSLNPAALLSKIKHANTRENGSQNYGATNTLLLVGKKWAAAVMAFDILKSFLAVKIAQLMVPLSTWAAMAAGFFAVIGHCFPFYMKFKGGKGLAAYGGIVLAYNPLLFILMLATATVLIIIVNYSFIMPFYAAVVFPIHVAFHTDEPLAFVFALAAAILLFCKHFGNFKKARRGEDIKIREYIRTKLMH